MRIPQLVRRVTDPLLIGMRVPVLGGVNRGRWWSLISAGSGHATGRRTHRQLELLARLLRPADLMWDIGAHHGFVTLCASRAVGEAGQVHSFEPSPLNRSVLCRHLAWNAAGNVTVHPYALSDFDGTSHFGGSSTSKTFALGTGGDVVEVRRGDGLVAQGLCPAPTFVKIDVEGAEAHALAGLIDRIPRTARLLIAMHNRDADQRCEALLSSRGFVTMPSYALAAARAGEWRSDPDLFAVGPDATMMNQDAALLRAGAF